MSKQTTLFDRHREETHAVAQPPAQEAELQRVTSRIGHCVIAFIQERGEGGEFHAADLHEYVKRGCQAAPASADRVMRELRRANHFDYVVVNRSQSLYRVTKISEDSN